MMGAMTVGVLTAAPAAAQGLGHYGGSSDSALITLDAVALGGGLGSLANVAVAPSFANADSEGLGAPFPAGLNSAARATNLDADVLSIALQNLLVEATQTAPPDNATPAHKNAVGPLNLDPLLRATVSDVTASARWLGPNVCVPPGTPIAQGKSFLDDVGVLTLNPASATVGTNNAGTTSDVTLQNLGGLPNSSIVSTASFNITGPLVLLGGVPGLTITVKVIEPVSLIATATGVAGDPNNGVKFSGRISVQIGTGTPIVLDLAQVNSNIGIPGVLDIIIGKLSNVNVAADGTSASGDGTVLEVKLLGLANIADPTSPLGTLLAPLGNLLAPVTSLLQSVAGPGGVVDLTLGASTASAFVPVGGVPCNLTPLEITKTFNNDLPVPGSKFDYNVTVHNRGACTLTNVVVTDTITGPPGASIVSSDPPATSTNGLTTTFNLPDIPPGQTKVIRITVQVPAGATPGAVFHNEAPTTANCDGRPVTGTGSVNGPTVGQPVLPRTGGNPLQAGEGFTLMAGAGLIATLVRRSRRSATAS